MPSEKSERVARRKALRNRAVRSQVRTFRTRAERALQSGSPEQAGRAVLQAVQVLDRAARKGVIHPNKAARLKSRLMKRLNALAKG